LNAEFGVRNAENDVAERLIRLFSAFRIPTSEFQSACNLIAMIIYPLLILVNF